MKYLFIAGTRPEGIKLAPLIKTFQTHFPEQVGVCITAQHRQMMDQVLNFFDIKPDYDLNLMQANQTLFDVTAKALKGLEAILEEAKPEIIFVQGDTTTVLAGALAAFYKKIKIAHIEAGLRSHNLYSPFPEEGNRQLVSRLADFHFTPTPLAAENLRQEAISKNVFDVGNTVIDALFMGLKIIKEQGEEKFFKFFDFLDFSKKIILVTGHRRESFGEPFENICQAIKAIHEQFPEVIFVYPMHLNPQVREPVNRILTGLKRVFLVEPLEYPYLIWLMNQSHLVLTDSGGIQEEAPSLGKPVLVMREVTERTEGVAAGTAKLVGTDKNLIVSELVNLLTNENAYHQMAKAVNPYGDGSTSEKIAAIIKNL
ncbi:MAG: UDP-N-acetylglucosamine 2-epimerase (non-hydrolyzing) [Verrucomicrobia bacterium]|nr:UDP-N-acetylglucosamine 2-epimerase (non-hydrolyzing) [Cytophagales bacterium]